MNYILLQKQEPVFIITKSLNEYPNIKAQKSDKIQPLEKYGNSFVVFDDMLLSKQENNNDLFLTRARDKNVDFHYKSRSYFHLPKNTIRNNSKIIILFKHTLRDIKLLFHDVAGLDVNLEEWEEVRRKAWENDYDYFQIDRFAKIREGLYTFRICNKSAYTECTHETKPL